MGQQLCPIESKLPAWQAFAGGQNQEMLGKRGNIIGALTQGGQGNRDHIEPVVKVLAKGASSDHRFKIAIGGGNDSRVDCYFLTSADPANPT